MEIPFWNMRFSIVNHLMFLPLISNFCALVDFGERKKNNLFKVYTYVFTHQNGFSLVRETFWHGTKNANTVDVTSALDYIKRIENNRNTPLENIGRAAQKQYIAVRVFSELHSFFSLYHQFTMAWTFIFNDKSSWWKKTAIRPLE